MLNRFGLTAPLAVSAIFVLLSGVLPRPADAAEAAAVDEATGADTLGTGAPEGEAEEAEGPNKGRISFTVGNDFTNAYFFRGILQEKHGFIWEPSAELSINLYEGDGVLQSLNAGMGLWFSFQSEKTGWSGSGPSNLYETDYYPSVTASWSPGLTTSVTYLVYTSPNGAFATIQEIDLGFVYDDSELLGPFAIGPTATFGFETQNSGFRGTYGGTGGYLELGGAPSADFKLPGEALSDYPVTMTLPLAVGLSLYDYYKTDPGLGVGYHNQTFGFFGIGLNAGVPLAFVPSDFGAWTVNAGITGLFLSETLRDYNDGQGAQPIGVFSVTMAY